MTRGCQLSILARQHRKLFGKLQTAGVKCDFQLNVICARPRRSITPSRSLALRQNSGRTPMILLTKTVVTSQLSVYQVGVKIALQFSGSASTS
jgi:hypothetical protein